MWKKIAVAGAVGACVLGAGTAALAASGDHGTTEHAVTAAAASSGSSTAHPNRHRGHGWGRQLARDTVHAQWVTKSGSTYVTHDAIRGDVTAVSATSITVKASDGVSETYSVGSATKVHTRADKKSAVIGDVKTGDPAYVVGTGTGSSLAATQVVDTKK